MLRCSLLLILGLGIGCLTGARSAEAQTDRIYYSRGVQAYFGEEWSKAEAYFDRAIDYGPGEPRSYYFRGLARHAMGQPLRAESDIQQGAVIEAGLGRVYQLGAALRATRGEGRQILDRVRTELLGGLPVYQDGDGLPRGSERRRLALRSRFRLSLDMLDSVDDASQLAQLVSAARPSALDRRNGPIASFPLSAPPSGAAPARSGVGSVVSGPAPSGASVPVGPSRPQGVGAEGAISPTRLFGIFSRAVGRVTGLTAGGAAPEAAAAVDPFAEPAGNQGAGDPFADPGVDPAGDDLFGGPGDAEDPFADDLF